MGVGYEDEVLKLHGFVALKFPPEALARDRRALRLLSKGPVKIIVRRANNVTVIDLIGSLIYGAACRGPGGS
jgi:hypothetical protein